MSPNTENGELNPIAKNLTRKLNIMLVCTVVVYLAVIGLSLYGASIASDLKTGVCTFVEDLNARADQGEEFLDKNPNGFQGLDAKAIQQQIDNQRRTATVLDNGVGCS
jgi:predicted PurR-regulated permease PerM